MTAPRIHGVFHEPMGVDFSAAVADGLRARLAGQPPEAMARVTVLVNTHRMARRLTVALSAGGAALLPRIGLVSDLAPLLPPGAVPLPTVAPLALRLRLTRLVHGLLAARPDLSPPAASFDLAGTLQSLLAEMQEEGMDPTALEGIDTGALSAHWRTSLDFLGIVTGWVGAGAETTPAATQDAALDALALTWAEAPPRDPVIVAGSTASRAPTRRLMALVAALPQGAVILPGVDDAMPTDAWDDLLATHHGPGGAQDHPQYRHAALLADLGLPRDACLRWSDHVPASPARNALVSLAMRPAPATDAWLTEGPALEDIPAACAGMTLLAAPTPGAEAAAIAAGLRAALAGGRRAALITPDRILSRQVAAQLDRWGIEPDDSAGRPLVQSQPGRLLMQAAAMLGAPPEAEALAILLAHPLTHSGADRAAHLTRARAVETGLLRAGPCPSPDRAALTAWVMSPHGPGAMEPWHDWLAGLLDTLAAAPPEASLAQHLCAHLALFDRLTAGSAPDARTDTAWQRPAGRAARAALDGLVAAAPELADLAVPVSEYGRILHAVLAAEEVRDAYLPHPDVMIWGALEARVRTADLVILGGLNDGVWPDRPGADPWLNRAMRAQCGLRLPERTVGLSAHDFQQAAAGPEVWLSRATRDGEAETVPSRWLNRIEGLLAGLGGEAAAALAAMRARGDGWLRLAARLDAPDARHPDTPAPRPAPVVPAPAQPHRLSVTAIETLIRDPYAIYATHVLRLRTADPLRRTADARLRGSVVHAAMERFIAEEPGPLDDRAAARLRRILEETLAETAPWPAMRRVWLGKFDRVLPDLIAAEATRRAEGTPLLVEATGELAFPDTGFTLTARADRLDDRGGAVAIYDYKTGKAPTAPQQEFYAKQLLLQAVMVADGAFPGVAHRVVDRVAYLQIGSTYVESTVRLDADLLDATRTGLRDLIAAYAAGRPWIARLAPDHIAFESDYDQLSRYGEWDDTDRAAPVRVGP